MQEDGCCAINESCSQHYGLFIAAVIILLLVLILLVVLMVFCIRRYLHEKKMNKQMATLLLSFGVLVADSGNTFGQEPTPGFNTKIPEWVLTPDTVETKLGTLEFFDGIPNEKSAEALFANLDLNRALQIILNGMPASNFEAGRTGHVELGQTKANQAIILDGLMDSNSLFLTGNAGRNRLSGAGRR